jgi:pyruvate,water dikinase
MAYIIPLSDERRAVVERVGPKAATLARLAAAGLPVPDGFCLSADAYRAQLGAAHLEEAARRAGAAEDEHEARRHALAVRLGMQRVPMVPAVESELLAAWRGLSPSVAPAVAVRSSALLEDTPTTSFAGQFDTFLGIASEDDLMTAVRACWAALWATRALRYMRGHGVDPSTTAMSVLVQQLVAARTSGGALSRDRDGHVLLTGTWGLGTAVAQGEVVPDRYVLGREGALVEMEPGRKDRLVRCAGEAGPVPEAVGRDKVEAPCLAEAEAREIARLAMRAEALLGMPVEIEWAIGEAGPCLLQARALRVDTAEAADELWLRHPGLRGHPAGVGWGEGRARLVLHEHDLEHVEPGEVIVTQVAGPALTGVLPLVAGVVAELGGSTSHLAALARERGIPAVLGVAGATRKIPDGARVAVDGVAGVVRWQA